MRLGCVEFLTRLLKKILKKIIGRISMLIKGKYIKQTIKPGIDFLHDPKKNTSLFVVKFGNEEIAIYVAVDSSLEEHELQLSHHIAHLIAFYLNKLEKQFDSIFKECGIDKRLINVFIFADNYCKRSPRIKSELSSKVNEENPIYLFSSANEELFEIIIVYSVDYIDKLFILENNQAEQLIIKNIIINIYSEFINDLNENEIEEKADKFIELNIPDNISGFPLEKLNPLTDRVINYSPPLNTSETSKTEVEKLVVDFFRNNSIKSGKYNGEELKQILNELFKFIQSELENEIKKYNNSILYFTYAQIEFLRNYRESMEIHFGMAQKTYTEYDIPEEKAKFLEEVVMRNTSFQHLIETILKVNSQDGNDIKVEEFQYLEALTTMACELALASDSIHYTIIPYELVVNEDYSFILDENTFDNEDYLINHSKKGLKDDFTKYKRAKHISNDLSDDKGLDSKYDGIENTFINDFGFKFTDFLNIIFALAIHINPSNDDYYPMIYLDQDSLVKEVKNTIKNMINQKISDQVILNVLEFISLPYETFRNHDPFLPNLLRMNENRFSIKPLIKFLDNGKIKYIYGVWSVYSAGGIYSNKISMGRFPYQLKNCETKKELKKMEKIHNKNLEKEVDKIASDIFGPENVISNLKKFKNIDKSLPNDPDCGEIDSITVDKSNKILYVLEAKDVVKALSPNELRTEFNKFFDPAKEKNYSKKLLKKVSFVAKHLNLFLKFFNVSDDEEWIIKFAFVTYEVHLSAFHKVNNIDFIPLSELEDYFITKET